MKLKFRNINISPWSGDRSSFRRVNVSSRERSHGSTLVDQPQLMNHSCLSTIVET